ncbi:MarR family winged helix-turn-helix transcriptional regulator [Corynebacterium sp.]|uniref:MarR family winged helix-turn-helix transcriptional regulator n=1 Tax=Corynebacterium sp. TaxID=1720 RepID=UPI0026DD925F|nr:MarR family winged helix-turn-helix transcriptional regulator [Corynebacterium sp.]MDO5031974.1 MarR family winged helix-turn-helix transcriptional regulator [Corynebacterium sp.]
MNSDTRWLSDDEQELWRLLLAAFRKINRGMEESLMAASELSVPEYGVLVNLSEAPNHQLRLRELCDALQWDRSRTSHQVTRMVKRGLVTKQRSSGDARGVMVEITEQGLQQLESAVPEHVEAVRRMVFDHLDEDAKPALKGFFRDVLAVDSIPGTGYSGAAAQLDGEQERKNS